MAREAATAFDALAREYDAWYEKEPLLFAIELEAIKCVCPSPGRPSLEVGTGSGRFASALGVEFGIDPSMTMLNLAKARGVISVRAMGEAIPFQGESLAAVFILFTLCFVRRPLNLFKECGRVLRPGGRIVVACINKDSAWGKLYEEKKQAGHPLYRYATFYASTEVEELLIAAGFKVDRSCSTLLQPPGRVESMEYPRTGILDEAGIILFLGEKC
ncbi:MAG: class I SAM-dependent methyltransferase [Thermodesulfobacteriota bacterium]